MRAVSKATNVSDTFACAIRLMEKMDPENRRSCWADLQVGKEVVCLALVIAFRFLFREVKDEN